MARCLPISHGSDGAEGDDEASIRVRAAVLPTAEGGHEVALGAIGFGDYGGEATVREKGVGRATHTHWVAGSGIGECSPLGAFID